MKDSSMSLVHRKKLQLMAVLLLISSLFFRGDFVPSAHAESSQYFPQTGHSVSGKFLTFWQENGGLAIFGYPITDAQNETDPQTGKTFLTQWFERNRFELHPENAGTPYEVELGLLGRELTSEAQAVDPAFQPAPPTGPLVPLGADSTFQYVPETRHNLSGAFWHFWADHGGVAVFGLPISEAYVETDFGANINSISSTTPPNTLVQWFERARFELHITYPEPLPPIKPGQPIIRPEPTSQILLGLLGKAVKGLGQPSLQYNWQTATDSSQTSNYGVALDSAGNIYASDNSGFYITKFDPNGHRLEQWPIRADQARSSQSNPTPIAIDTHDNLFVLDSANDYVKKFDLHGKMLAKWGGGGSQDGHFLNPLGIATDNAGNVYVADSGNDRIQKFDNNGQYLMKWGTRGGNDGQLIAPEGVATDNQGHVYVADTFDNLVVKFDTNGNFLLKWGGYSTAPGKFKAPRSLVTDKDGNLFVLEGITNYNDGNNRIQKFDPNGHLLTVWGSLGYQDNQFGDSRGIAVDETGNVYLDDGSNQRILKFDGGGHLISKFSVFPATEGRFFKPVGGAIDLQDNLFVTDAGNQRVQELDASGHFLRQWGSQGHDKGQFDLPTGIATDRQGNVYVADNNNSRIQKFDNQGQFLLSWGSPGNGNGQFKPPEPNSDPRYPFQQIATEIGGLATDSANNVFVADIGNNRIQKFDSQGHFVTAWETKPFAGATNVIPTPEGTFKNGVGPAAVAIDKYDNVYVVRNPQSPILKYDAKGNLLLSWMMSLDSKTVNSYPMPLGVAINSVGNIFVSDSFGQSVQKFDSNGQLLQVWSKPASGYNYPHPPFQGMVLDSHDNFYFFIYFYDKVVKYSMVAQ